MTWNSQAGVLSNKTITDIYEFSIDVNKCAQVDRSAIYIGRHL